MLLKSFPVVTPKLDDIRDEEEEHDADDSADVWEVTSVLERDFEDPNAWSVLEVDSSLLLFNGCFWFGVELNPFPWLGEILNIELSLKKELRL